MIEEYGVVEAVTDDGTTVRITMPAACDQCTIRESCHAAGKTVTVPTVYDMVRAQPVRLVIRHASVLQATLVIYGIPFIALLAGLFGSYFVVFAGHAEETRILLSFAVGAAALLVSGFLVARLDRRLERRFRYDLEPIQEIPRY